MTDRAPPPARPLLTSLTGRYAREQRQNDGVGVAAKLLGDLARRDEPIGPRTTYRVGGAAALFVEVTSDEELARVAEAVAASGVAVLVIGKGSNMLVADNGFPGLAIALGEQFAKVEIAGLAAAGARESRLEDSAPAGAAEKFADIEEGVVTLRELSPAGAELQEAVTVRVGGAAFLPVVARQTVRAELTGFEWAVGVPGSIGGAVRMNAGGHGSDMADVLSAGRIVDLRTGEDRVVPAPGLELSYRRSSVLPHDVVVWAELNLRPGDRAAGEKQLSEIVGWRRANQPGGQNAGSVFTNPPGDSAGRLIEEAAGCKGLRIGTAEVSTKHANFFQADRDGSADDIRALMREVQRRVHAATGVELHPETCLVGFETPLTG